MLWLALGFSLVFLLGLIFTRTPQPGLKGLGRTLLIFTLAAALAVFLSALSSYLSITPGD